jgi:outer membrane receptor protein involved in Fe transport
MLMNRFELIYDDANTFSLEAGAGYTIPKTMNVSLAGSFNGYNLKNEIKPWHKPAYQVTLDGSYTFLEKYTASTAVFLVGPAPYRYFLDGELLTGDLDSRLDLNLGFSYRHNPNFSAFLQLNNILNQRYELWYRYPVQGFQVMAGLGFSF